MTAPRVTPVNRARKSTSGFGERPVKVVTAANASIVDRAQAWNAVEAAQQAVNEAAQHLPALAGVCGAYATAMTAYVSFDGTTADERRLGLLNFPALTIRADKWHTVERAQRVLNEAARDAGLVAIGPLLAALEHYVAIGGEAARLPGVGGLS